MSYLRLKQILDFISFISQRSDVGNFAYVLQSQTITLAPDSQLRINVY